MRVVVDITADGLYHVTNVVNGIREMQHVHTKESYERWKRALGISEDRIIIGKDKCSCGMQPGDVEECDDHR